MSADLTSAPTASLVAPTAAELAEHFSTVASALSYWADKYKLSAGHVNFLKQPTIEVFEQHEDALLDLDVPSSMGGDAEGKAGGVSSLVAALQSFEDVHLKRLDFMILKPVGKGAFGRVFKGVRVADGAEVALKVIDLEEAKEDVQTIATEIRALAASKGCPQLITYYTSYVTGTLLWIAMEYLDAGSVLDKVKIKPLRESAAAIICREVLLGLDYLALDGKIHRDIKAANILLSSAGNVKLADFGASGQLTDTMTKCNTFVGSPYWMAPEVMTQSRYDGKADIWSLGITLLEMLNGKPPMHDVPPLKAIRLIPKNPSPQVPRGIYGDELTTFINACLTKDPAQRPSLSELLKFPFIRNARPIEDLPGLLTRSSEKTEKKDKKDAATRPEPTAKSEAAAKSDPEA
jgi:serine/threonine-protein kinase 24/25/MST4